MIDIIYKGKKLPDGGIVSEITYNNPDFKLAMEKLFNIGIDETIIALKFDKERIKVYIDVTRGV